MTTSTTRPTDVTPTAGTLTAATPAAGTPGAGTPGAAADDQGAGATPQRQSDMGRRSVITGALALAGGASLAACGSSSSDAGGTPASTSSTSSPSSSASASGSSTAAQAAVIVKLADVPVGSAVSAKLNGKPIIVSQPTKGTVAAFSAICTHQGCPVKPSGGKLNCPCHGSVFDAATGKVLNGPANSPLPAVSVKLDAAGDGVVAG